MRVFRGEALLDVIFAASAILLIFLLLLQPGAQNTNFYRQSNLGLGCFGSEGGGAWDGQVLVFRPGTEGSEPKPTVPRRVKDSVRAMAKEGVDVFRIAVMLDSAGGKCFEAVRDHLRSMAELSDLSAIVFQTEAVPCASRTACESRVVWQIEDTDQ